MNGRLPLAGLLALLAVAPAPARAADPGPVKVFLLAGQSNMEGYGGFRTFDALGAHPTQGALLKQIRKDDGSYVVRDDVFVYYPRHNGLVAGPLTVGQGAHADRFGPELFFGLAMGDCYQEPVLLIKTCWGGKDLYCDFRPPGAGKPPYAIPGDPREPGAYFRKMVDETRQALGTFGDRIPQIRGRTPELCGFVWFQGWNDYCADNAIKQRVYDEYARNFALLVTDLRAALRAPKLPVVFGEVGVDGEPVQGGMAAFRAAQAKVAEQPELAGTLRYVRTAPFWYPELDELPRQLAAEEHRVRKPIEARIREELKGKPEASDRKKADQLVNAAVGKALASDAAYQKVKAEHDRHVSHWICHYQGSARVYALIGHAFAEAMQALVPKRKSP